MRPGAGPQDPDFRRRALQHQSAHRAGPLSVREPAFRQSALSRYTPRDFGSGRQYGIAWHEKTLGQLFCDQSARQIVDMLLEESGKGGVDLYWRGYPRWSNMPTGTACVWRAGYDLAPLVIATGGPVDPQAGATGFAYDLPAAWPGRSCSPPALVPLTLSGEEACSATCPRQHRRDRTNRAKYLPAKPRCSPIAGCPARQSCRCPRTGDTASASARLPARLQAGLAGGGGSERLARGPAPPAGRSPARTIPTPCASGWLWRANWATCPDKALAAAEARLADWSFRPRHRRLRQGGSHRGRHQHRRTVIQDAGIPARTGTLCHWRSGGRYRLAGRLQLPMAWRARRRPARRS